MKATNIIIVCKFATTNGKSAYKSIIVLSNILRTFYNIVRLALKSLFPILVAQEATNTYHISSSCLVLESQVMFLQLRWYDSRLTLHTHDIYLYKMIRCSDLVCYKNVQIAESCDM